jgi:hypothetical protein
LKNKRRVPQMQHAPLKTPLALTTSLSGNLFYAAVFVAWALGRIAVADVGLGCRWRKAKDKTIVQHRLALLRRPWRRIIPSRIVVFIGLNLRCCRLRQRAGVGGVRLGNGPTGE